jgi:hypothetical protein
MRTDERTYRHEEVHSRFFAILRVRLRILSTDREMIPVRNAIDAHAQVIVEIDEMLLSVLKVLTHFTLTLHPAINS